LQIASAGAAASLADTNKKSVDLWKPGSIPAAEKAAFLAKDYEADPLWHPELSTAGSKAALLASDKGAHVNIWKPRDTDDGHSAAEQAVRKKVPPPIDHRAVPADASRKALMAATGAMASSRRRADSAPLVPIKSPGSPNSAQWALKAATQSQRGQRSGLSNESSDSPHDMARVQNIAQSNVNRQMYTSHPPVAIEVEEKNRQDTIRASAVAMAQKLYAIQQRAIEEAKADISRADSRYAARNVHNRRTSDASSIAGTPEPLVSPLYGNNLQEAAQRLAQERLAKLRDENEEYKNYYGQRSPTTRSRLSIHNKLRRRASSDGAVDNMDEEQSRKIRSQMSIFQNNLAAVDEKKRQKDRDALLAAAQRNVRASMHSMDEEVLQETGKSSPAQREEWAAKAKEKAQADSTTRMENYGKVHIGGGKYLDQADVDAVARSRIQPTLDDITEKVETQRAREAEIKLEQEEQQRQADLEKQRTVDTKAEQKRARGKTIHFAEQNGTDFIVEEEKREEKSKKAEEKKAHKEEMALLKEKEKVEKEELKTRARLEKEQVKERHRLEEEEKRKSKEKGKGIASPLLVSTESPTVVIAAETVRPTSSEGPITTEKAKRASSGSSESPKDSSDEERLATGKSTEDNAVLSPSSPSKGQSKVKSWLAGRFRRSSKAAKDSDDADTRKSGFIGGASLTGASSAVDGDEDKTREASMRDVAIAGRPTTHQLVTNPRPDLPGSPVSESRGLKDSDGASISSLSESGEEATRKKEKLHRGRLGFKDRLLGKANTRASNDTDEEEFEEARDTFDEAKLAPPPKLTATGVATKASASPVRDSKFSENL
jgi:Eisosome protein 1